MYFGKKKQFRLYCIGVMSCDNVVTRDQWGARPSKSINLMSTPVGFVFIHHTAMSYCFDQEACSQELKIIQNFHMDNRSKFFLNPCPPKNKFYILFFS